MPSSSTRRAGRHFLQIPGPTNVPDRVLRAIDFPTVDHRGPEFGELGKKVLADLKRVFKSTRGEVVIYPASGTGAWEAALVNTLSPLASIDYHHDEWGVDVTVAGSQKGLMLPPGLSFNCVSPKALAAAKSARLPRSYWAWDEMIANGKTGYFPYTPATNMLYGLAEALKMLLDEEGLDAVFARHQRHAEATRRAVRAWGLEIYALDPREYSASLTGVLMPAGHDADRVRTAILDAFDLSLGPGLTQLGGKMFRIGHLGDFNDLMLMGTLAGVEMGLQLAAVPVKKDGVQAAMQYLSECAKAPARRAA